MKAYRITAVVLRHAYEIRHNWNHSINMLYLPVINLLVWGFFSIYLTRRDGLQPGLINCLLGAVILWGLFNSFQRAMAQGFLDELWSHNLVGLFASPLSVSEYVAGLIAVNLIKVFIGTLVQALIAGLCYHFNIFPLLIALVPFMLNLMLFALAVGIVVTALFFRYTTKLQDLAWSFALLLMPFSCVFYPLKTLPSFLRPLAWILPTTHSFEGMRQAITDGGFSTLHFQWGLALNVTYLIFAMLFFHWMFESARSRGLLVKVE